VTSRDLPRDAVERTGSHSIRFRAKDILEAARFLEFVSPGLTLEKHLAPAGQRVGCFLQRRR